MIVGEKSFNTDYKNELDILNDAINDLNSIAFLITAKSYLMEETDIDNKVDMRVSAFLSNLLYDVTNGINTCLNKKLEGR
jgi:hypothetical protein